MSVRESERLSDRHSVDVIDSARDFVKSAIVNI